MSSESKELSRSDNIACMLFAISLVFCSSEMLLNKPIFSPRWPRESYYMIMTIVGGIAGGLVLKNRISGVLCSAVAGSGALFSLAFFMERFAFEDYWKLLFFPIGLLGILPSVGLYLGLRYIFSPTTDYLLKNQQLGLKTDLTATETSGLEEADFDCNACPSCGCKAYRKKLTTARKAVKSDRVCLNCGEQYSAPKSRWATFFEGLYQVTWPVILFGAPAFLFSLTNVIARVVSAAVLAIVLLGLGYHFFIGKGRKG